MTWGEYLHGLEHELDRRGIDVAHQRTMIIRQEKTFDVREGADDAVEVHVETWFVIRQRRPAPRTGTR